MKRKKLNYRFHNPNTDEQAAEYILQVLIEANRGKVEAALKEAASQLPDIQKKTT